MAMMGPIYPANMIKVYPESRTEICECGRPYAFIEDDGSRRILSPERHFQWCELHPEQSYKFGHEYMKGDRIHYHVGFIGNLPIDGFGKILSSVNMTRSPDARAYVKYEILLESDHNVVIHALDSQIYPVCDHGTDILRVDCDQCLKINLK
jgi:hypothetical protein